MRERWTWLNHPEGCLRIAGHGTGPESAGRALLTTPTRHAWRSQRREEESRRRQFRMMGLGGEGSGGPVRLASLSPTAARAGSEGRAGKAVSGLSVAIMGAKIGRAHV